MGTARSYEISVNFYQVIWRHMSENDTLQYIVSKFRTGFTCCVDIIVRTLIIRYCKISWDTYFVAVDMNYLYCMKYAVMYIMHFILRINKSEGDLVSVSCNTS
jgi:hypothetical protein